MKQGSTDRQISTSRNRRESQPRRFQRIYKAIRERICLLEYAPGTVLNEGQLADEFEVSRTPIRNVLQRLNYEGLLKTRNGVGTIVSEVDIKTFKDIYALRMSLAESMGELSPVTPTPAAIEAVKKIRAGAERLQDGTKELTDYARLCNELHELIIEQIGNKALREMTDLLYYRAARTWLIYLHNLDWSEELEILQHECSEILFAMEIGDMRGVGHARRQFLFMTLSRISRYLTSA